MSRILTLEVSDEIYTLLQRQAQAAGTSPAEVIMGALERQYAWVRSAQTEVDNQVARTRFERHFGALDIGRATGADNDSIDADLAGEYSADHEQS